MLGGTVLALQGETMATIYANPNPLATVLWVGRQPTPSEIETLRQKLKRVRIVHVSSPERAIELARRINAKIIVLASQLPIARIAELFEHTKKLGITLLRVKMKLIAQTSLTSAERLVAENPSARTMIVRANYVEVYEFEGFEQLEEIRIVAKPW